MADALLSLVTDLLKQLGSFTAQQALQELQLLVGFDDELQNLQYNLKIVQAMLNKFEERRLWDEAVKLWYDQLEEAYYMMDDVLDKWKTAKIKLQIQKEEEGEKAAHSDAPGPLEKKMKKVWSFFPSPSCCFRQVDNVSVGHEVGHEFGHEVGHEVGHEFGHEVGHEFGHEVGHEVGHEFGHKIKELNETLASILKGTQEFGIDLNSQPERVERLEITSTLDVSKIVGRNEYKDDPLNNLLGVGSQEGSNPLVISLVGIGGIGKSTLAKLAYNHSTVRDHFQKMMWVSVSDPFDQYKVAKAIVRGLDPKHESLKYTTNILQPLLRIVCDLIKDKKFFLVFDDVWAKDIPRESEKWEPFKDALTHGAQGSRILVTTRKEEVAHMMGSTKTYIINLGNLSVDDCWLIIRKIAFIDENIDQHKDLEPLGRQLAYKCRGLPLAAKLIGGYMCNNRRKEQWVKVLESSLWDLEDVEKGLLGQLLLSYCDLSLAEKQCFLFCAIFPKDHVINRFELIIHWMAQGYTNAKENMEMEDIAEEYFEKLAMRSFFQDFEKDENDGRIKSCKMHDIVHDFAQSLTKDVCFTIEGEEEVHIDFKRARQLSLIVKETFPEFLYEAKNLRFLYLDFWFFDSFKPKLFDHLTSLYTLHLKGESILELPNEVEILIHIRLLKLSCEEIKELPESICNLCNLQSLDVSECWKLDKLPQGIGKLINLRHFLLHDDCEIKSFPKGIGQLTSLRTLSHLYVGVESDEICKLGVLKNLNHIQGSLKIQRLSNLVDLGEVKEAQLNKKTCLRVLCLSFDTVDENIKDRRMKNDVLILNALEPPPHLEEILISHYKGTTMYPDWMMFLTKLKKLVLSECWNLERLPPLGKLPFLESVRIEQAYSLKKVGDEFLGIESKNRNKKDYKHIIFPNLKFLQFEDLYIWEDWIGMEETREEEKDGVFVPIIIMPNLHSLSIKGCPNLKSLPDFLPTISLQVLVIGDYLTLHKRDDRSTAEEWPKISHIPNINIGYRYVKRDGHEVKSLLQASLIEKISHIQNIINNR